jgi:hypothetical protein
MATIVDESRPSARGFGRGYLADQAYFTRFTIILALFIMAAFIQFSLRGFVDVRNAPLLTHAHGALMVAWLGIVVAQNLTAQTGRTDWHRQLGWTGAALTGAIMVVGVALGFDVVAGNRAPPFFSAPYFLALTTVEPIAFAGLVAWGVALRRNTQWHRRAMLGAMVVILEPALGRLLPMPLLGGWGEWTILALQLSVLAMLALHDRGTGGRVHPATLVLMTVVTAAHLTIFGLSVTPAFAAYAETLAAG